MQLRIGALLASALLVGGLSACAPEPDPTPTATTGFASEAEAFAAAEATYRAYVDALNAVDLSDPETFEPVFALTTGDLNHTDRKSFSAWAAEGHVIEGDSSVNTVEPLGSIDNNVARFKVCYDVSAVDVLNAAGESLVSDERPPVQSLTVTVDLAPDSRSTPLVSSIDPAETPAATC